MYSIDFAEQIWACDMQAEVCMTPVLQSVCDRWDGHYSAWAESYLRDEVGVVGEDF